jgi:hypothetical protein
MAAGLVALALAGCSSGTAAEADPVAVAAASKAAAADAQRVAENKAAQDAAVKAQAAAEASASAAAALPPDPADFTIAIDVLSKECFGSAGCNVTFRIDPTYTGGRDPNNLEITYEVLGGEDPMIDTFTIDGNGTATFDDEAMISTASSSATLTAKVVKVRRT